MGSLEVFFGFGLNKLFVKNDAITLRWRHNGHDCVSNHQPRHCLLNRLFERSSKKTSKLRVTGLCVGNSPGTGEFPAQRASYAENVSIWWRHHDRFQGHVKVRMSMLLGFSRFINLNLRLVSNHGVFDHVLPGCNIHLLNGIFDTHQ